MERHIASLLLIHLVFLVLSAPPYAATSAQSISKFVHVSHLRTWWAALYYCRKHHTELVTIRNIQENNKLAGYDGWIGLIHRNRSWEWNKEEAATFFAWDGGEPGNGRCVVLSQQKWKSADCSSPHPFLCNDDRLILVQEMKTWEEALLHCRALQAVGQKAANTTHLYDLASLPEASNTLLDREAIGLNATTIEVWIGLRFLAGEWFWISGEAQNSSDLPRYPAQQQHCGTLVHNSMQWKTLDCAEKRNFLCIRSTQL